MKALSSILVGGTLSLVLLSCTNQNSSGNHDSMDSTEAVQHELSQSGNTVITIEAFEIIDSDGGSGKTALSMDDEGKCYLGDQFIGTITSTGELKSDKGQLMASLKGDQLISDKGKVLGIIKNDGTISNGSGKDISWGADGVLTNSESGLKIIPTDSKAKRAASMLLSAFFGFSSIESKRVGGR